MWCANHTDSVSLGCFTVDFVGGCIRMKLNVRSFAANYFFHRLPLSLPAESCSSTGSNFCSRTVSFGCGWVADSGWCEVLYTGFWKVLDGLHVWDFSGSLTHDRRRIKLCFLVRPFELGWVFWDNRKHLDIRLRCVRCRGRETIQNHDIRAVDLSERTFRAYSVCKQAFDCLQPFLYVQVDFGADEMQPPNKPF